MLLPLRRLRRLTLPERAVEDHLAVRTLGKMPWVPHVHYWGRTCGERAHLSTAPWRVHPWLHQLGLGPVAFACDDYSDDDVEYIGEVRFTPTRSLHSMLDGLDRRLSEPG